MSTNEKQRQVHMTLMARKICGVFATSSLALQPILFHIRPPHKMFRFPSPDFSEKQKRRKKFRITCKEASTLSYKHTILSY